MRRLVSGALALFCHVALADEGMWQPAQLPGIAKQLTARGLRIDPAGLSDLTGQPMGAVVQIPGCTASFVSAQGLVVTNHHCAYGGLQFNSTPEKNLIKLGLKTGRLEDELPGDPNARVYVTEEIRDVSAEIAARVPKKSSGFARHTAIDAAKKALVVACEKQAGYHCDVYTFHGGVSYQLVRQLEIKDVRLVYAPPDSIGKFGGDVDNWTWPRHTGDFAFLRAYVSREGKGVAYAKDNVPYHPKHWLEVNPRGLAAGDFAMVAGYPGRTYRYRTADEVADALDWQYPTLMEINKAEIDLFADAAAADPAVGVKYASIVASRKNATKKYVGVIEGFARGGLLAAKRARQQELAAWLAADAARAPAGAIADLDALLAESRALRERDLVMDTLLPRVGAYTAAYTAYRAAIEREKPDAEREVGFQLRDEVKVEGGIKLLERRMDAGVDQRLLAMHLARYVKLPKDQRSPALDRFMNLDGSENAAALATRVAALYDASRVGDSATRLSWLKMTRKELDASNDAWLVLMRGMMPELLALERESKSRQGREAVLRPTYMRALIAFNEAHGSPIYPDANSSLRVSFGQVMGQAPKDGAQFLPFTTARGILQKTTTAEPFNTPPAARELLAAGDFGPYRAEALGSLPVDFMTDLDITGGNSGSPTLDADGRLVGLAFDGTWDSIVGDFAYSPELNRMISVDIRYMLWVMDRFDHADRVLAELGLKPGR